MAIRRLPSTGDSPRATGVPESLTPGGAVDSAGFPWAGRTFDHHDTEFAGDDGATPQVVAAAIASVRSAASQLASATPEESADRLAELADAHATAVVALSASRLLVPLLAEAGDTGLTPEGRIVEKSQELSIVTVASPDGRRVMPVFTSVDALRRWNPDARPIPVPASQVALAAVQEETDLIIVDPGSPDQEFGVRRTQLEALALGTQVRPGWIDPAVSTAFAASVRGDARIASVTLVPADPESRLLTPETDVVLWCAEGLTREELHAAVAAAQAVWAEDPVILDRVDSLRVRLVAAPR